MSDSRITAPSLIDDVVSGASSSRLTRAAFDAILAGQRLSRVELAELTGASPGDVDRLGGRALVLDANGYVVAAHGLSLVPARQHRLTLRGRQFWTWCAIDAVGIPVGLAEDAVAETTCHECGASVTLEFHAGELTRTSHGDARIWEAARVQGRGTAGPPHCALMNLFCSAAHFEAWRAAHPGEQGNERDLAQVGDLGRAEWAYLRSANPAVCGDDACSTIEAPEGRPR